MFILRKRSLKELIAPDKCKDFCGIEIRYKLLQGTISLEK